MPTSDPKPARGSLTETLSELESLITESAEPKVPAVRGSTNGAGQPGEIPVLDELVYADDVGIDEWEQHLELPAGTADHVVQMIDKIEHRLTDELEALLQTLKSTMKTSIIEELKTRLETSGQATPSPPPQIPGRKPGPQ